jgi:beta-galactosidase
VTEIRDRQILIDGEPRIVMCGEIHYFRVARDQWRDRIESLRAAGANTVASYIPWLFHELPDGSIDVDGTTRPERDVAAFIDLCAELGMWFLARPGPFVMAELKNEGLPYRVYTDHPEIVPVGWDAEPAPTRTVDYLAPAFLAEVRRWYEAVLPPIATRLQPGGGNVIGLQLDNEVGMLAWVTNAPDLTPGLVADFGTWVRSRYGAVVGSRYPVSDDWPAAVRSPGEEWAAALRVDLGTFMRTRFADYIRALRDYAESAGIRGVPFFINIHGTEGGGAANFPIGISQLLETYSGVRDMVSGSDHYVGEMTLGTTTDMYVLNAFSQAVHDRNQPVTSLEFEAGSGDYGGGAEEQYPPSTVELKTRLFVAQGNRLINYYLFAGGINPPLDEPVGDGNDRLSFTGERHGTAAPVGPEGQRSFSYPSTRAVISAVNTHAPWLARMDEEYDDIALGFVPDAYMTEYRYPGSEVMRAITDDLVHHRGAGPLKSLARSLLLDGYRFTGRDLQRDEATPRPRALALSCGQYLAEDVQRRVAAHVLDGGVLLLFGRMPRADLEGRPCTVLASALGVRPVEFRESSAGYFCSVKPGDWAGELPETRVGWRESLAVDTGEVLLRDGADGSACGVLVRSGAGAAVVLSASLGARSDLFGLALRRLGIDAALSHDATTPGLFATTTADADGQRLIHLLNVSGYPQEFALQLQDKPLLGGHRLAMRGQTGLILGMDLRLPHATLAWSTAELTGVGDASISVALDQPVEHLELVTSRTIRPDPAMSVQRDGDRHQVTMNRGASDVQTLTLY